MFSVVRDEGRDGFVLRQGCFGELEYLTFPGLEQTQLVEHLFTTRTGGVSRGIYSSMNLSFSGGDEKAAVLENYRRIAGILGCEITDMTVSRQTHGTNIRFVTEEDRGKGVVTEPDYDNADGLITDIPGIALVTLFADCVPLFFVDRRRRAIGLAHSGRRGTVQKMGIRMVEAMEAAFGTRPEDLLAAVGPSICRGCYEVGEDVAEQFWQLCKIEKSIVLPGKQPGKYQLDLWLANKILLEMAGIPAEQIFVTDICTCHNPGYLFSHRASGGRRGNLGAFLMLKRGL